MDFPLLTCSAQRVWVLCEQWLNSFISILLFLSYENSLEDTEYIDSAIDH